MLIDPRLSALHHHHHPAIHGKEGKETRSHLFDILFSTLIYPLRLYKIY